MNGNSLPSDRVAWTRRYSMKSRSLFNPHAGSTARHSRISTAPGGLDVVDIKTLNILIKIAVCWKFKTALSWTHSNSPGNVLYKDYFGRNFRHFPRHYTIRSGRLAMNRRQRIGTIDIGLVKQRTRVMSLLMAFCIFAAHIGS
ncbi:hypothetical protein BS47DRAFT_1358670 [Hydnum rufescens UP504]|uniref:Uncharacterized protein n=1 Tax=Hydnum rufescens UP504 TaxID=1448309 RepID=A0A9P6E180_9AGAM|nr:hypothetical protein BS47DRAFT_1358670 [Hydnum rufescens UP504]